VNSPTAINTLNATPALKPCNTPFDYLLVSLLIPRFSSKTFLSVSPPIRTLILLYWGWFSYD